MIETGVERVVGDEYCCVFTGERKFITKLNQYKEEYPGLVEIRHVNEDGSVVARVPFDWFRFVKPPSKRNMTEEQRKAAGERMKQAREAKGKK